ncbi:MAG: glycosyltransferase [Candidatus Heimdallarchaeaceae archaeon]
MNSLISIITPLYNYKQYIIDLIKSVQGQTYSNWEHIIIDDGSTDNPYKIIQPYLIDRRIQYIQLNKNQGYSHAKNEGIVRSRGKYIVMIDADDMLTKDSIKVRKKALDENPGKLWCHGEVLVKTKEKLSKQSVNWKRGFRKELLEKGWNLDETYHHRLIHAQSVMICPELHRKLGLYDEKLRFSADNEMFRRIIKFGHVPVHINEFVAIYRLHPGRMARSKYKKEHVKEVKKQITKDIEKRFREGINKNNTRLWK